MPLNEPETYDVHLFPVIRLKISGITASSPAEAIEMAQSQFPTEQFERALRHIDAEDAEEYSHYLVDVAGDEDFERSRFFLTSWAFNPAAPYKFSRRVARSNPLLTTPGLASTVTSKTTFAPARLFGGRRAGHDAAMLGDDWKNQLRSRIRGSIHGLFLLSGHSDGREQGRQCGDEGKLNETVPGSGFLSTKSQ